MKQIDKGIQAVVTLLQERGFETFSSCEGGAGHAFQSPTVRIKPKSAQTYMKEVGDVATALASAGCHGYYVKVVLSFQGDPWPWDEDNTAFIEVEFWQNSPILVTKKT